MCVGDRSLKLTAGGEIANRRTSPGVDVTNCSNCSAVSTPNSAVRPLYGTLVCFSWEASARCTNRRSSEVEVRAASSPDTHAADVKTQSVVSGATWTAGEVLS